MNNNTITKLQAGLGKAVTYFILLSCLAIFAIYLIQRFGTSYAEEKIQEQLTQSGLAPFVHYESIHLDPFTLTPSLENISFGNENAPWLRFARISFNSYPINYPDLNVDFWIKESPINSLSRETRHIMRAMGIDTLLGKGSFSSNVEGENVSSQFKLDIKDIGKFDVSSKVDILDRSIDMSDLRSDILASFALGQPEALPIIYGDAIELHALDMRFAESGLFAHLFPQASSLQGQEEQILLELKQFSQTLGLAPANSTEATVIAKTLQAFLKQPEQLTLNLSPSSPISLKELTLMASQDTLYKDSNMKLSNN